MKIKILNILFYLALLLILTSALPNFPKLKSNKKEKEKKDAEYEIKYFSQTLDHFSFVPTTPSTFQQRYLISTKYWIPPKTNEPCENPILFYTGNEGDIELFWDNTGFVTDTLSQYFNALVIFAEHRYYGQSLPFGNSSFQNQNSKYLTSEQALADYAVLLVSFKKEYNIQNCPVIAFGGSYGGMLSAWGRIKYPHVYDAALASSAPILQFLETGVSPYIFAQIATQDYTEIAATCSATIRQAFNQIVQLSMQTNGLNVLSERFHLCTPLTKSFLPLYYWLYAGLTYMAMADYPYAANFLEPMPAWPVTESCYALGNSSGDAIDGLIAAITVYYNYTGEAGSCFEVQSTTTDSLGTLGWDYQACTEMVMPMASDGINDMFLPVNWNVESFSAICAKTWQVQTRPYWVPIEYGATKINAASNIIFSNGRLDPWRGGGVQQTISDSLIAIIIKDGAHHLDLRLPTSQDPDSVIQARQQEIDLLTKWISQASKQRFYQNQ
eukprot:TRINITY_DN355_c0_g6_i1.p1 TRINITY_DN355_c0_g6~~TRINITY_DN355_c0_g6_i1.p1  ORF type:complete len:497 (-),score=250.08 TRINITY_DN355_c0_g6_i1:85-1575(-)